MTKTILTHHNVLRLAASLAEKIIAYNCVGKSLGLYGVPRGGIPAMYAVASYNVDSFHIYETPESADVIIYDIIDSGATYNQYKEALFDTPFYVLIDKRDKYCEIKND